MVRACRQLWPFLTALLLWGGSFAWAGFGFEATDGAFIIIDNGSGNLSYRLTPSTGSEDPFDNFDFDDTNVNEGFYNYATNPIYLNGFVARTFETGGDDITGVTLYWRQYLLGESPGLFRSNELVKVADLGLGVEEYQLQETFNLNAPNIGNLGGRVVFELYAEAQLAGGGTAILESRDSSNPFQAFYTDIAIPEPAGIALIFVGIFTLRYLHVKRRKASKAAALHADF